MNEPAGEREESKTRGIGKEGDKILMVVRTSYIINETQCKTKNTWLHI